MTTLIGQQLGRYLIQEEIGRGGMARVYRALDVSLQRQVALKVLAPQLALDQEFLRRFEREAVTAARFNHPNIVTVHDVGEANGLHYISMAYVRGRTLHAIIKERGALGLGLAVGLIAPVAAALDYAHSQGAVHRDVKPQNILIDVAGRVLLADFGIAQATDASGGERLTRTGIFMGTPEYISPEQASAQRVDGRSDLYSLGIATYEVITGVVPFSGATPQLIVAHVQRPPPPPSSVSPEQPPELDMVLARVLAKRPEHRFGTGAAFVEALRIVARRYGIEPASPERIAELVLPQPVVAGRDLTSGSRPLSAGASLGLPAARASAAFSELEDSTATPTRVASEQSEGRPPLRRPAPPPLETPPPLAAPPALSNGLAVSPERMRDGRYLLAYSLAGVTMMVVLLGLFFSGAFGAGQPPINNTPGAEIVGTHTPTVIPSASPAPTDLPTLEPTAESPTAIVEPKPTQPTDTPLPVPQPPVQPFVPTAEPTAEPTVEPTVEPYPPPSTDSVTEAPTDSVTEAPTDPAPTEAPTDPAPTEAPTTPVTEAPGDQTLAPPPTETSVPTAEPTVEPIVALPPTETTAPTAAPPTETIAPTAAPTTEPTVAPTP